MKTGFLNHQPVPRCVLLLDNLYNFYSASPNRHRDPRRASMVDGSSLCESDMLNELRAFLSAANLGGSLWPLHAMTCIYDIYMHI